MKPVFLIYCPTAFTTISGGVIALHRLAHNIAELGEQCFIGTGAKNPNYKGEWVSMQHGREIASNPEVMVVYPEVVKGNPFGAHHIMRWLLNTPGVIPYCDDAKDYAPGHEYDCDMFYKFANRYAAPDESKVKGELRALDNFFEIFHDKKQDRTIDSYIIRKGRNKRADQSYFSGPNIPPGRVPLDDYIKQADPQRYLADIFNRTKHFVSYDDACYLNVQAALCGAVSIVVPDPKISASEWYEKMPYFKYGIAYGMNELDHAKKTLPMLKQYLEKLEMETIEQAKGFVAETYKLMGE